MEWIDNTLLPVVIGTLLSKYEKWCKVVELANRITIVLGPVSIIIYYLLLG